MEENRKSSVETEMENYLKSELGGEAVTTVPVPDIVQNLINTNPPSSPPSEGSTEESLHTASEHLVTSAIISVDDMDSGDFNNMEKEKESETEKSPSSSQLTTTPPRGLNNSSLTLPKIQISPEGGNPRSPQKEEPHPPLEVVTDPPEEKAGALKPCPSPSRIPSRKNSGVTSLAINDDLRRLETRLERFVSNKSSEGSECSETSENSGARSSATVSSRLHSSGTASSRAKTADKSSSSGNSSPQEKTSTMLKNTLRKMTRFSMGSNVKRKDSSDQETETAEPKSRSRNPFTGKSRVPKSQSPAPSGVARSKSFKEPGPPVSRPNPGVGGVGGYNSNLGRNNVYTSSLRRTKIKHQNTEDRQDRDNSTRATSKTHISNSTTTSSSIILKLIITLFSFAYWL